jgi:hypothetical protein
LRQSYFTGEKNCPEYKRDPKVQEIKEREIFNSVAISVQESVGTQISGKPFEKERGRKRPLL